MSVPPPMGFGGNGAGGFGARSSGTGITDEADFRGHDSYGTLPTRLTRPARHGWIEG